MQIEAADLRFADVVRIVGDGEREIRRVVKDGDQVRAWFRSDEDNEEPSAVWKRDTILEIQRPGDLFVPGAAEAKPAPQKRLLPLDANAVLVRRLEAEGWVHKPRGWGVHEFITDPTDTVRLRIDKDGSAEWMSRVRYKYIGRWYDARRYGWTPEMVEDLEGSVAKLLARAAKDVREREQIEGSALQEAIANTPAPRVSESLGLTIRYSKDEGVLIGGSTRTHYETLKKQRKPYRYRYSRNLPQGYAYYVPRTRGTFQPRARVELAAANLRALGIPVDVEYDGDEQTSAPPVAAANEGPVAAANERPAAPAPSKPRTAARMSTPQPAERVDKTTPAPVGRPPDNAKRAAKLRELADKLEARANAELSAERMENTPRRATMASQARDRARRQLVIAQTMRRAADVVAAGELEYISRIASQAQMEDIDLALRRGLWERDRVEDRQPRDHDREPEIADIEYATFTGVSVYPGPIRELLSDSKGLPDVADARRRLERYADRRDEMIEFDELDVQAARELIKAVRADDSRKISYAAERIVEQIGEHERLRRLGIVDTPTLRAALREYLSCCRGKVAQGREDPAAVRKRELRFAKIPGYFPTPRALAERVVAEAQIGPGMRVLEPSAGSGALAEVVRERHPTARLELIERQYSLRQVLTDDGFTLVGDDFTRFDPTAPYDRIIMNPPFEQRQDAEHIARALGMLAPGGRLVAIASASLPSRDDATTRALRERIAELGGRIEPLPPGSFKESGTDVGTVLIVVDQPAAKVERPAPAAPAPAPVPVPQPARPVAAARESAPQRPAPTSPPAMTTIPDPTLDIVKLKEAWNAFEKRRAKNTGWQGIPGTSCFKHEDDDSLTLCTAYQTKAIGSCPPSMAGLSSSTRQLMLCQPDHEPVYFRGQTPGLQEAKAEAINRIAKGRGREPLEPAQIDALPDPLDFDGQAALLAALVPSGIVYEADEPLRPIPVSMGAPQIVTPDGSGGGSLDSWSVSRPIPAGSQLVASVWAGASRSLGAFVDALGSELLPYRGPIGRDTLLALANLASASTVAPRLRAAQMTLADFRTAIVGGRSVYWVPAPDGTIAAGPITATGKPVSGRKIIDALNELSSTGLPLTAMPDGWTLDDTIMIAVLRQGTPMWWAWNTRTLEFRSKQGDDGEWTKPQKMPAETTWSEKSGYSDFPHVASVTLTSFLDKVPKGAGYRVAGPWLGYMFPSDFKGEVVFDEPTGGELDLGVLEREFAEMHDRVPDGYWTKLAAARLRWAQKRLADEQKVRRRQERAAKKTTRAERPAKPTPKPQPVAAATATSEENEAMGARQSKKAAKKAAKKATAKKASGAKKAASKKAGAKKAATGAKKATSKKAGAKKAGAKKAATPAAASAPANVVELRPASSSEAAAKPDDAKPEADAERKRRPVRFKRNDVVRFRKRSQIAAGLGVGLDKEFKVEMVSRDDGRTMVVLRVTETKHPAFIKVPAGHLALVSRGAELPEAIRLCAARLAEYKGPISKTTRRALAELAGRL